MPGLPLDLSAVISTTLEGILYGFSIFMFGVTLYILQENSRRARREINYKMLTFSIALLVCSTVHIIIDIVRACRGLVLKRNSYPGGPLAFFAQPSEWTFVAKNAVYTVQTLVGDGILIYRCYAVWQSWLTIAFPMILWVWSAVSGALAVHSVSIVPFGTGTVFLTSVRRWITAFFASTLATNFSVTILLAYKIWITNRRVARMRQDSLLPVVRVIADAGVLYSVTLAAALGCFVQKSNGQYFVLDMICPIISITFYMVIIRIGLAESQRSSELGSGSGLSSSLGAAHRSTRLINGRGCADEHRGGAVPMNRLPVQVHISKVCETDATTLENEGDTGSETDGVRDQKMTGLEVHDIV
ncbi:hypothetical protein GY45DRAFT_1347492 [Cubamyces sp. BRFM 1775]|nr:hypothetical protein GY45DRAFT_1347492 [Cubamyces sp. BRFM 1775]